MNPGKRGSLERNNGQKGSESRPSPALHDRSSGKHSPGSSHSPASKCNSIPLLQNEMSRAAGFLANFTGTPGFTPPVWQELQYLINPLAPSFMPPLPLGLDMFSSPFLHPIPGAAPGLFPPGLPLLRPPTGSGILHPPYAALFPNVNDIPVHLLPKPEQPGSRPRSAKKTSSLASSSSESDIAGRTGASNLPNKHDHPKTPHSNKQFWHNAAELAKAESRKQSSVSPAVSNSKQDEVVDILSYSDCDHDSPLELTVKKSSKISIREVESKGRCSSTDDVVTREDVNPRGGCEIQRRLSNEKFPLRSLDDDVTDLSLHKTVADSLKVSDRSSKLHAIPSDKIVNDVVREEFREKVDDRQHLRDPPTNETVELMKTPSFSTADPASTQISGLTQAPRQNIALPPRKRLTRNPEELGLGVPNESTGSDSPSSTSNFRSCWKKFAAKANHNIPPRTFTGGGKPLYDCRTFFQKMAAKDACKSGILIGKTFIAAKGKGYFHRTVSRTSPRFTRNEGGTGVPPDGSSSPRVTRSQSKLKQKKSVGSPKSSPTEPQLPVRKSLRKKTANSKYEAEDVMTTPKNMKKDTPSKGKGSGKSSDKESGKSTKSSDSSEPVEDGDLKKSGKPYSLRDREEKPRGKGSKACSKDLSQRLGDMSSVIVGGCGVSDSLIETPEKKRDSIDDWPEEKGSGGSLKNVEQDRKSVSSSCSTDIAFESEMNLSLPPKFRRTKRKTISTSQSLSSVEDERSSEGVRDAKIDLCRSGADPEPLSNQLATEAPVKLAGSLINLQPKGNLGENIMHSESLDIVGQANVIIPSVIQENKPLQESTELDQSATSVKLDVIKKTEVDKTEMEKRINLEKIVETKLGLEKRSEIDKPSEVKTDKLNRPAGGKKSILYRSSLNAMFDDSSSVSTPSVEANVVPSSDPTTPVVHNTTAARENNSIKIVGDAQTRYVVDEPGGPTSRAEETSLTESIQKNAENDSRSSRDLVVSKQESVIHQDSVESVTEPKVRSILELIAVQSPHGPSISGIPVPQIDSSRFNSKEKTDVQDVGVLKHGITVIADIQSMIKNRSSTPVCSSEAAGNETAVSDIPTSEFLPNHEFPSGNESVKSNKTAEEQTCVQDVVHSQVKVFPQSGCTIQSVQNDTCSNTRLVTNEQVTNDVPIANICELPEKETVSVVVQSISKRKSVDDKADILSKRARLDEILENVRAKTAVDETFDDHGKGRDPKAGEIDNANINACVSVKNLSVANPLHFYNKSSSLLPGTTGPNRVEPGVGSDMSLSHTESLPPVEAGKMSSGLKNKSSGAAQVTLPVDKSRSVVSTDLQVLANDSEPPVLEKTDFTYIEQFSDISDTDEEDNRGPPLLEATNGCTSSNAKPCSSFALDKHILFAKIASSALQDGVAAPQSGKPSGVGFTSRTSLPVSGEQLNEHKQVVLENSGSSASLRNVSGDSISSLSVEADCHSAGHLPPILGMSHSDQLIVSKPSVTTVVQHNISSKRTAQKNLNVLKEQEKSRPHIHTATDTSSSSKDGFVKGPGYGNTTLSSGDLETCDVAMPPVKDPSHKAETLRTTKDLSQPVHCAKNDSNLDSLLQHCRSVTVVVQKIDDVHKSQNQNDFESREIEASARGNCVDAERGEKRSSSEPVNQKLFHETKGRKADSAHRKMGVLYKNSGDMSKTFEAENKKVEAVTRKLEISEAIHSKTDVADIPPSKTGVSSRRSGQTEVPCKRSDSAKKMVVSTLPNKKTEKNTDINKAGKVEILPDKAEVEETIPKTKRIVHKSSSGMKGEENLREIASPAEALQQPRTDHELDDNTFEGTENKPKTVVASSASSNSSKVAGEKSNSRKRKLKVASEVPFEEFSNQKQKSSDSRIPKIDKNELSSVYDFEKDSLSTNLDTSLSRKEFSKTETRRPLRLKLLIPEQRPLEEKKVSPVVPSKSVSTKDFDSKTVRDRLRNADSAVTRKPAQDSCDKIMDAALDSNSNSSAVGHVKCRLVKVGRHQWMSVGEGSVPESNFSTALEQNKSALEMSCSDESLLDSKSLKEAGKNSGKVSRTKANVSSTKQSRAKARNDQPPRQKRGARRTRNTACSDISVSDNSMLSQDQSIGVMSPNSSVGPASHYSESESIAPVPVEHLPVSVTNQVFRIPDFLDALLGDDFTELGYDEVNEVKDFGNSIEIRWPGERANFGKVVECELDEYLETLSPASTFFMPSEIELKMAEMTISDYSSNAIGTQKMFNSEIITQQSNAQELQSAKTTKNVISSDCLQISNKENSPEIDRLLTDVLCNQVDKDDPVNPLGEEVMEEFVSWLSPKWDETKLHDFDDPWNSMNLLSPIVDLQKSWEHLTT